MSGGAQPVVQRSSAMPGDTTHEFDSTGFANGIQALQADGFQVGLDPRVNAGATTYYFAAWNAVPGKVAVGVYTGDGATLRNITGVGVFPEWAHVTRSGSGFRTTHKPASTGVGIDRSLLLQSRLGEADSIQALLPDGFQVGGHSRVNSTTAPNDYYWAVFGPHTAATNYRSIGNTAVTYGTSGTSGGGTRVSVSNGSAVVAGLLGTTWYASNRGRGDVITIPCDNPPTCTLPSVGVHYAILAVASDGSLQLSQPYQGTDDRERQLRDSPPACDVRGLGGLRRRSARDRLPLLSRDEREPRRRRPPRDRDRLQGHRLHAGRPGPLQGRDRRTPRTPSRSRRTASTATTVFRERAS